MAVKFWSVLSLVDFYQPYIYVQQMLDLRTEVLSANFNTKRVVCVNTFSANLTLYFLLNHFNYYIILIYINEMIIQWFQ